MSALYFLIPLALVLLVFAVALFLWALRRGQFEDLESPAHSILIEDREEQLKLDAREKSRGAAGSDSGDNTPRGT